MRLHKQLMLVGIAFLVASPLLAGPARGRASQGPAVRRIALQPSRGNAEGARDPREAAKPAGDLQAEAATVFNLPPLTEGGGDGGGDPCAKSCAVSCGDQGYCSSSCFTGCAACSCFFGPVCGCG